MSSRSPVRKAPFSEPHRDANRWWPVLRNQLASRCVYVKESATATLRRLFKRIVRACEGEHMAFLIPAVLLATSVHAASPEPGTGRVPVLVELFTSEGCSSCPPADTALARLLEEQPVPGARIIALGEHVDYWDDLGWKDPFSSTAFSQRQISYARRLQLSGPYTPQLVIGGRSQVLGSDSAAARAAIAAQSRSQDGKVALHVVSQSSGSIVLNVEAHWNAGVEAEVVIAAVEDRATTTVTRGENAGRTLTHVAVVRSMSVLGTARGAFSGRVTLDRSGSFGARRTVAFVQERGGGRVHGVESIDLPG